MLVFETKSLHLL